MLFKEYLNKIPNVHYLPEFDPKAGTDWYGIKALWYEGAPFHGKRTKVFAYIGYPDTLNEKSPAVVLVHGGCGHAFAEWVKLWNSKGFVAIAMDTTGFFPSQEWQGLVGTEENQEGEFKYTRELYGGLTDEEFTTGPNNSSMKDYDSDITNQWMYHAVTDVILAHNILSNDPRVDDKKIGIKGISWGSVITTIAIGYDSRFAFAIPIYGSAYLTSSDLPNLPNIFSDENIPDCWFAENRLNNVDFPVLWMNDTHDRHFHCRANSMSYLATKDKESYLAICNELEHGHIAAWELGESYRFAECMIRGKQPFVKIKTEPKGFEKISFEIAVPKDFEKVTAKGFYLSEDIVYDDDYEMLNKWDCFDACLEQGKVMAEIPFDAKCYYIELKGYIGEDAYISTTVLVEE